MQLDYATLEMQRRQHPAWRLLAADSAPLVASFLHRVFVVPNVRVMAQSNLVESLEDTLYGLRERLGAQVFPKLAQYGLQLFEKLNFQLLIITPAAKNPHHRTLCRQRRLCTQRRGAGLALAQFEY